MKEKGFTAVEMIITLFVVAAAFLLISTIYSSATRLTDRSEDLLIANSIAFQKLQLFENRSFETIPPRVPPVVAVADPVPTTVDFTNELPATLPAPREGTIILNNVSGSVTLKDIFIRIKYQSPTGERILEYRSLVQPGGLGR